MPPRQVRSEDRRHARDHHELGLHLRPFQREAMSHFKADEYLAKPVDAGEFRRLIEGCEARRGRWPPDFVVPPAPDLPGEVVQPLLSADSANDTLSIAAFPERTTPTYGCRTRSSLRSNSRAFRRWSVQHRCPATRRAASASAHES